MLCVPEATSFLLEHQSSLGPLVALSHLTSGETEAGDEMPLSQVA